MADAIPLLVFGDDHSEETLALARLLYECKGDCYVEVASAADLIRRLRAVKGPVARVVFLFHGAAGTFFIRRVHLELPKLAQQLRDLKLTVTEAVVLDGCNVLQSPSQIVPLMKALHAPKAIGY